MVVSITTAIFFEIALINISMDIKFTTYKILVTPVLFKYIPSMMEVECHQLLVEVI